MRLSDLPFVPGVRHRDVDLGEVRLHVAEAGEGTPIVLLHGWPQHWWCWRHLMPRLAETHRVIAPDLRGFGWSDAPPGDYSKATFAADLLALLDVEGLEPVRLVGHDWGGIAAFLLASERPERVEGLVALDIALPRDGPPVPRPRHLGLPLFGAYQVLMATPVVGQAALTRGTRFVRTIIRAGSAPGTTWTDEELDAYATVLQDPARARASSSCYRTFLTRELPSTAAWWRGPARLEVPTLLVMGEASPLRRVLDPRPRDHVRVEQIPGAGHFLPEESPDEVFDLVSGWFGSDGAGG